MDLAGKISQVNGRLKSSSVGVQVQQIGDRLYLRATLPPKPGSQKQEPYQQRIALGIHANPAGLKEAEAEARKVGALVDCKEFDWAPYLGSSEKRGTIADWLQKFEVAYFTRRKRSPKSELTWKTDYAQPFRQLPAGENLTAEILLEAIARTEPDTKTRKRYCMALGALAKFAGLELELTGLAGDYSPTRVEPRNLPTDLAIAQWREKIENPAWRWAYGAIAVWGLRNHEVFHLDLSKFPIAQVMDGKTGARRIWPIYPEWATDWGLIKSMPPNCTGKTNGDLGHRVTNQFRRFGIPFNPYDLRHAWAVRSIEFGLPQELAAQQMGHSFKVHCEIYHHWISEDVHQRAYDALLLRSDRPRPPSPTASPSP